MGLILIALFAFVLVGSITAAIAVHRKAVLCRGRLDDQRIALLATAYKKTLD